MIEIDARDQRAIGVEYIDRIEPAAQSHFEYRNIDAGFSERQHRRQRAKLEISERGVAARGFDALERAAQHVVVHLAPADTHALVVAQEVRRGVAADAVTRVKKNGFEHRAA